MDIRRISYPLLLFFVACGCKGGSVSGYVRTPAARIEVSSVQGTSVTLSVRMVNAGEVRVLVDKAEKEAPMVEYVVSKGRAVTSSSVVIEGLEPAMDYNAFAVAVGDNKGVGKLEQVRFRTADAAPSLYPWESSRKILPKYMNMALVYGGSSHRTPYTWTVDRFAPSVTCIDGKGREHWLFDSFLAIEFVDAAHQMAYMLGQRKGGTGNPAYASSDKLSWMRLIDYWFSSGKGLEALDACVASAEERLGKRDRPVYIVMSLPDAIPYRYFDQTSASTVYWGELHGKEMDFSKAEDRLSALRWYIDEVRRRFNAASFQHIELAGFYVLSEDLATPGDGWSAELKNWDQIYPALSQYIHSLNESLSWIPYYLAAGYKKWKQFEFDYVMMQPNHFWDAKNEKPLARFWQAVKTQSMSMEFEFDDAFLDESAGNEAFKARFREYLAGCKSNGLYNSEHPFSYYMGEDTMYKLAKSKTEGDKALYSEFCEFVTGHRQPDQQTVR